MLARRMLSAVANRGGTGMLRADGARHRRHFALGMGLVLVLGVCSSIASSAIPSAAATSSGGSPGVTAKTVTVGQVDDLTVPVPGLFKGAEDGTQAYIDYVNSKGGVNGRKIVLDVHDSLFQGGVIANATTNMINNDFAMVGGYSVLDAAEQPLIDAAHMPNVANPIGLQLADSPYAYSPYPTSNNDYPLGFLKYLKKKYPTLIKHVGILWANATQATQEGEHAVETAMRSLGYKVVYARGFGPLESTFLPDILAMESKGVQLFYCTQMPGSYAATVAKEMQQQNFHPMVVQGAAYSAKLLQQAGPAANHMYIAQSYTLYLPGSPDARNVPAVALFDHWMKVADPNADFEVWAVEGWMSAELFVQALKNAGSPPTRAGLLTALNKIKSFDGGGLIPPVNPAQNIPSSCFLVAQVRGGQIVRVPPTPKTGFVCGGGNLAMPGFKPEVRPAP